MTHDTIVVIVTAVLLCPLAFLVGARFGFRVAADMERERVMRASRGVLVFTPAPRKASHVH